MAGDGGARVGYGAAAARGGRLEVSCPLVAAMRFGQVALAPM